MVERHEIDRRHLDAYERSVRADKLVEAGRLQKARRAMAGAAALDGMYSVRAELLGEKDTRRVQVSGTVRRTIVPFLAAAGFDTDDGTRWSEGRILSRRRADVHQSLLIARHKFGQRLGVMTARRRDPSRVESYDWRLVGLRSGSLAYKTQLELEAVCARWCALISSRLWPWFEERP